MWLVSAVIEKKEAAWLNSSSLLDFDLNGIDN